MVTILREDGIGIRVFHPGRDIIGFLYPPEQFYPDLRFCFEFQCPDCSENLSEVRDADYPAGHLDLADPPGRVGHTAGLCLAVLLFCHGWSHITISIFIEIIFP
jgi:hypothetical protein